MPPAQATCPPGSAAFGRRVSGGAASIYLLGLFPRSLPKDEVTVLLFCLLWCLSQSSKAAFSSTAET